MDYREFEVPESLRRQVQCVWRLRDTAPTAEPQVIYPDGRCELIVHLAEPMAWWEPDLGWVSQLPVLFAAQQRVPIRLAARGPLDCLGVRLQPAASVLIGGVQLAPLRERIISLDALDRGFARALASAVRLFCVDDEESRFWRLLATRLDVAHLDPRIEAAIEVLDAAQGQVRIPRVAELAGMPLRSFQMRFLASVGLGAKEYARVLRLQAAVRLIDAGRVRLADIAADVGFSDQAHATRELQLLTGLTPARLAKALRDQRNGEQTLRTAAAFVRGRS